MTQATDPTALAAHQPRPIMDPTALAAREKREADVCAWFQVLVRLDVHVSATLHEY